MTHTKEDSCQIVIITGMSGAGKSTALKAFEDCGFETFDNIPLSLATHFIINEKTTKNLAIGFDIRTRDFKPETLKLFLELLSNTPNVESYLLFMDCENGTLQRRFTETRRKHPLAMDRRLEDGLEQERKFMFSIRNMATVIIDTTETSPSDIKNHIENNFIKDKKTSLSIFITSFSYKFGVPRNADLVFDVRFLKNPHYIPELQKLTGNSQKVGEYIASDKIYDTFFQGLTNFIEPLLPRYISEGKSYLTIAFGCTGGKHRSVFVANELKKWLAKKAIIADLKHREIDNLSTQENKI